MSTTATATTTTTTKLDRLPLENAPATFPQLEIQLAKMVNYKTNASTGVDIHLCLEDGYNNPRPPVPDYMGTNAQQKTQDATYNRDTAIWTLNEAAHSDCLNALIEALANFDTVLTLHGLSIFGILQLCRDSPLFAMDEGTRQHILRQCTTIAPGATFLEHAMLIENQTNPELQLEISQVRLLALATSGNTAFRKSTEMYNLQFESHQRTMANYKRYMLHAITVHGETASCNSFKAKPQPVPAAAAAAGGGGRYRQPSAATTQPANARYATTVAQKCLTVPAGTHATNNTPTGANATPFFCFFHGHNRSHPDRNNPLDMCRLLHNDPLATAAMKAATGPCVLANTLGTFYHSCPNVQA